MGCKDLLLGCLGWRKRQPENGFQAMPGPESPQRSTEPGNNQHADALRSHEHDSNEDFGPGNSGGVIKSTVDPPPRPEDYFKPPPPGKSTWDDDEEQDAPKKSSPVRRSSPIPIPGRASKWSADQDFPVGHPPTTGLLSLAVRMEDEAAKADAVANSELCSDNRSFQTDSEAPLSAESSPSHGRTDIAPSTASSQALPVFLRDRLPKSASDQGGSSHHIQPDASQHDDTAASRDPVHVSFVENVRPLIGATSDGTVTVSQHGQVMEEQGEGKQSSRSSSSSSSSSSEGRAGGSNSSSDKGNQ